MAKNPSTKSWKNERPRGLEIQNPEGDRVVQLPEDVQAMACLSRYGPTQHRDDRQGMACSLPEIFFCPGQQAKVNGAAKTPYRLPGGLVLR